MLSKQCNSKQYNRTTLTLEENLQWGAKPTEVSTAILSAYFMSNFAKKKLGAGSNENEIKREVLIGLTSTNTYRTKGK